MIIFKLLKPWIIAAGGALTSYVLFRKNGSTRDRLREAKIELIEQQRTIDRLRAELGRERHERQQSEKEDIDNEKKEEG